MIFMGGDLVVWIVTEPTAFRIFCHTSLFPYMPLSWCPIGLPAFQEAWTPLSSREHQTGSKKSFHEGLGVGQLCSVGGEEEERVRCEAARAGLVSNDQHHPSVYPHSPPPPARTAAVVSRVSRVVGELAPQHLPHRKRLTPWDPTPPPPPPPPSPSSSSSSALPSSTFTKLLRSSLLSSTCIDDAIYACKHLSLAHSVWILEYIGREGGLKLNIWAGDRG